MKYKVGERIKIINATNGCYGANGKIGTVTNKPSTNGLCYYKDGFNVDCGSGQIWRIGFASECELLDELTAEEAIGLFGELCCNFDCSVCPINSIGCGDEDCSILRAEHPGEIVKALKQWKKDHKKKKVETEIVNLIRIIKEEGDSEICIYAYKIDTGKEDIDEKMNELVKQYYKENGGKIYAKCEHICRVKVNETSVS